MKWTRAIQLRSEEWGYKTALFGLCGWTVFNIYQSIQKALNLKCYRMQLHVYISVQVCTNCHKTEND